MPLMRTQNTQKHPPFPQNVIYSFDATYNKAKYVMCCHYLPCKHYTFNQCCFNVGPSSTTNVVLMLAHRLRRWPNIKTTLVKCTMFAGFSHILNHLLNCLFLIKFLSLEVVCRGSETQLKVTEILNFMAQRCLQIKLKQGTHRTLGITFLSFLLTKLIFSIC